MMHEHEPRTPERRRRGEATPAAARKLCNVTQNSGGNSGPALCVCISRVKTSHSFQTLTSKNHTRSVSANPMPSSWYCPTQAARHETQASSSHPTQDALG
jgi:hypothetical protein